jgi:hypothetical protein
LLPFVVGEALDLDNDAHSPGRPELRELLPERLEPELLERKRRLDRRGSDGVAEYPVELVDHRVRRVERDRVGVALDVLHLVDRGAGCFVDYVHVILLGHELLNACEDSRVADTEPDEVTEANAAHGGLLAVSYSGRRSTMDFRSS